jgi:hypothetical protein
MSQPAHNPQLNLALSIVAPVIMLIAVAVLWFTKPEPVAPTPPTAVNTTASKLPDPGVSFVNALPGAGSGAASGGAAGGGGFRGGPPAGIPGSPAGGGGGGRSGKPLPGAAK